MMMARGMSQILTASMSQMLAGDMASGSIVMSTAVETSLIYEGDVKELRSLGCARDVQLIYVQ